MTREPYPLQFHLRKSTGPLTELMHRISEHQTSLNLVRSLLPAEYRAHCLHVNLRQNEVLLLMDSPVWANRTRYVSPAILEKLNGLNASTLKRVRIQIAPQQNPEPNLPKSRRAALSPSGAETILGAADSVSDPALATALRRLAQRSTDS